MTAESTTAIRVLDPRPRSAPSIRAHRLLAHGLLRVLDHRRVE